jgi:hypothetical protein
VESPVIFGMQPLPHAQALTLFMNSRAFTRFCGTFCLEDGTRVNLSLGRELSSAKEITGNRIDFTVAGEVRGKDVVVIQKGAPAYGAIVEAQARRRMGRAGKLNVRIDEVRLADGSRAKLRAVQEAKGQGRQGVLTAAMIGMGGRLQGP